MYLVLTDTTEFGRNQRYAPPRLTDGPRTAVNPESAIAGHKADNGVRVARALQRDPNGIEKKKTNKNKIGKHNRGARGKREAC